MKVSLSLSQQDVDFLDRLSADGTYPSRSAAAAHAIAAMRDRELTDSYVEAFDEWAASGEAELWDVTVADGFDDDAEQGDPA
jgi:Arc/MetJ-type ribon-helix-helix transcriptional regulator